MGIIHQVWIGVNIETVSTTTQASLIQHGHHSYTDIRSWSMDRLEETRKNDQQDASPLCSGKVKIQEKMKKSNEEEKTRNNEEPTNDEKQKKKEIAAKTLKERQKKVTAQTQIATKTAKFHSWETPMKTLTRLKLKKKKKIGSNTRNEARD